MKGALNQPLGRRPALLAAVSVLGGVLTGLAVVLGPLVAWSLLGSICVLLLFLASPALQVGAIVLAAVGSRLLVATGLFPEILNFFHFPLALVAALAVMAAPSRRIPLHRTLGFGLLALLTSCLLSWLINGGAALRPWLDWLVFAEPFLIIFAVSAVPSEPRGRRALWGLVLAICVLQLPLAVYQLLSLGPADFVQGLFIGMGAGAHVAGGVSLLGSLLCLARALSGTRLGARSVWLLGSAVFFAVAVMADAKQVIVVFLPALTLMLFALLRLHWTRVALMLPVVGIAVLGAFSYYRPLQMALDWGLISHGVLGKVQAFGVIASRFSTDAGGWLFGLGPGNSVSRLALMGLEGYIKSSSPVRLLGLAPSRTTVELWNLSSQNWLFASSSVWSLASSWLGLLGDLGLVGLGTYGWLLWRIWRGLQPAGNWQVHVARAVLLMCVLLGFLYSWLEEPGFMVPAALLIGQGLLHGRQSEAGAGNENPAGP
jgi:hypothetical protein